MTIGAGVTIASQGATRYNTVMAFGISHDRSDESPEAKARWFQSLTLAERMDIFCEMTDLALSIRPDLAEKSLPDDAECARRGIRILRLLDL